MVETLLNKVWDAHTVRTLPSGQTQPPSGCTADRPPTSDTEAGGRTMVPDSVISFEDNTVDQSHYNGP